MCLMKWVVNIKKLNVICFLRCVYIVIRRAESRVNWSLGSQIKREGIEMYEYRILVIPYWSLDILFGRRIWITTII